MGVKSVDFISIFLHQINKNGLEINTFGPPTGAPMAKMSAKCPQPWALEIKGFGPWAAEINKFAQINKMSEINNLSVTR